jgi:short subunit dehydrogenase-like uncharacterized protein
MRTLDVVCFGSTGFTGQRLAAYMAKAAPPGLKWAIAGRDRARLDALAAQLGGVPVLVADAADRAACDALAASTRVIASTAGPFIKYGDALVDACVAHGTHWCDITGETPWIRGLIDRDHEAAIASGARVVPACGFDSVPSDIGVYVAVKWIRDTWDQPTAAVLGAFSARGGLNGGTLASALELSTAKGVGDPALLSPAAWRERERASAPSDLPSVSWNADLERFVGPFFMAATNTRVVRRSRALWAEAGLNYGGAFTYGEVIESRTRTLPWTMAIGMPVGFLALRTGVGKSLARRFGPKPGEGPSAEVLEHGFFRARILATAGDGRKALAVVEDQLDPGNGATVKMLGECALALAAGEGDPRGGVRTPATALGDALVDRLRRAGMTITVGPL